MYVVLEGPDGSGKSTLTKLVAEELRKRGRQVVEVCEPYTDVVGRAVRSLLPHFGEIDSEAQKLLMEAARVQLLSKVVVPALQDDKMVISDRGPLSTDVYQGHYPMEMVVEPCLTIILDRGVGYDQLDEESKAAWTEEEYLKICIRYLHTRGESVLHYRVEGAPAENAFELAELILSWE